MPIGRYSFCVDENLPHYLASHLSKIYLGHQFRPVQSLELLGTQDIPLFSKLQGEGFDAIITNDIAQVKLYDPAERTALRRAGLHWVGTEQASGHGRGALGRTCATITAGVGEVLRTWQSEPSLYWLDPTRTKVSSPQAL